MEKDNKIRIGILPQEQIRERMLAIAAGVYKPDPDEPKIWLTSRDSLSDDNLALLGILREKENYD